MIGQEAANGVEGRLVESFGELFTGHRRRLFGPAAPDQAVDLLLVKDVLGGLSLFFQAVEAEQGIAEAVIFKGLDQIVRNAPGEQGRDDAGIVGGSDHDHRRRVSRVMHQVDEFIPVHAGHEVIENDQVSPCKKGRVERAAAIRDRVQDLKSGSHLYVFAVNGGDHGVIFNDQNLVHAEYPPS